MNGDKMNSIINFFKNLWDESSDIIINIIIVILIFVLSNFILKLISKQTKKVIDRAEEMEDKERSKSIVTSMTLIRSLSRYLIYIVAAILALCQLGFESTVSNIILTAGVGGLIISLSAKSIVTDLVAGIFLVFEQQYSVGDYVKIGGQEGTVTSIAARVTYLTNVQGQKIIVPHGEVTTVLKYGTEFRYLSLTIPTRYQDDTSHIIEILKEEVEKYYQENKELFIEQPKVLGISSFNTNTVDISITGKTTVEAIYNVERSLRLAIKQRCDQEGILLKNPINIETTTS